MSFMNVTSPSANVSTLISPDDVWRHAVSLLHAFDGPCNNSTSVDAGLEQTALPGGYDTRFSVVIDGFVVGLLCTVGFVGNALSFAVLSLDTSSATNWLLRSLAVLDSLFLVTCFFVQPLTAVRHHTDWIPLTVRTALVYVDPYAWIAASVCQTCAVWTVVVVTIDRYIAVCRPMNAELRSHVRVKVAMTIVVISSVVYNIPMFLETTTVTSTDSCNGLTVVQNVPTSLRNEFAYFVVYKVVCFCLLRSVGPTIALIVFNGRLITVLRRRNRRRQRQTQRQQHQSTLTLTLVVVVSVFIVSEMPDVCLRLTFLSKELIATVNERSNQQDVLFDDVLWLMRANKVSNALLALNSSVNFAIYCLICRRFRNILVGMLSRRHGSSTSGTSLQSTNRYQLQQRVVDGRKTLPVSATGVVAVVPLPGLRCVAVLQCQSDDVATC